MANVEQIATAFSLGEANVGLEGFRPHDHPLYDTLKAKVIAGELTIDQMCESLLDYSSRITNRSAA